MLSPVCVTFDVYSALVDSRRGATAAFAELAHRHAWNVDPEELFDGWDARNKALQATIKPFATYKALARRALEDTYEELELDVDAAADTEYLLSTIDRWPHYSDVPEGVGSVAEGFPVALLTNIDDDLLARTDVGFAFERAVTSQQARCYKPHERIYRYAEAVLGTPLLHVPASPRDVEGSIEAGLEIVRIKRPVQSLAPGSPPPELEIDDLRELAGLLS
ncbi:MAG: haloacid dehalogenase [Actinobacteria bacterium]|nr:haloacid dehalogenase [Actinomycetota bacterium]